MLIFARGPVIKEANSLTCPPSNLLALYCICKEYQQIKRLFPKYCQGLCCQKVNPLWNHRMKQGELVSL